MDLQQETCIDCRATNSLVMKTYEGTLVCKNCGVINQESIIDPTNEKRFHNSEQNGADGNNSRVNARADPMQGSQGMNTVITGDNKYMKELTR